MRHSIFIRTPHYEVGNVKVYKTNDAISEKGKKRIEIEVEFIKEYLEGILIFELEYTSDVPIRVS